MTRFIAAALLIAGFTSYAQIKHEPGKHVVLPNPKLLRCVSSHCAQLWRDKVPDANDIYPKQVVVDLFDNSPCPLGVMARYDKSVSMDDLKAAIDEHYGQWALANNDTAPVKLWRVKTEKFAIQLARRCGSSNGEACEAHRRQRGAGNENRYLHGLSATPRL